MREEFSDIHNAIKYRNLIRLDYKELGNNVYIYRSSA